MAAPHEALIELITSYHELNIGFVEVLNGAPTPLQFLRYVHRNQPVVFKAAVSHWTAVSAWNSDYLRSKMGTRSIKVAETPFGNADAAVVNEDDGCEYFVKPHESLHQFGDFLDDLRSEKQQNTAKTVKYAQSQDDNMTREFAPLVPDVDKHISWASEALDRLPDATNVWIGGERSVTALHKDNYENIYCQITGKKRFVLISPFEAVCVKERTLRAATYVPSEGEGRFRIVPDEPPAEVPFWPTADPDLPIGGNVWWKYCRPLQVELDPGDVLYLPAMWYHKVSQRTSHEGLCCAVNYWYDMEFSGPFYSTVGFVRQVTLLALEEGKLEEGNDEEKDD